MIMRSANCRQNFDDDDVPDLVDNDGRIVVTAVAWIIFFADDIEVVDLFQSTSSTL